MNVQNSFFRYWLLLAILFGCSGLFAQQLTDTVHTDYRAFKGKLMVLNECHNVASNDKVYEHIVRQVASGVNQGDTLNLLLEMSYSNAYMLNRYLQGDTQPIPWNLRKYVEALKGLNTPLRIIGVDFEYDRGGRARYYLPFLNTIVNELKAEDIPYEPLAMYIAALKSDTEWVQPDRKEVTAFYTGELQKVANGNQADNLLRDLLFVLDAEHHISSHRHRDNVAYKRFIEAQGKGMVRFANNYNILIYGSVHTDPSNKHNIYSNFRNKRTSPFKDNVFSIAQAYIDCNSTGDYFEQKNRTVKASILNSKKKNDDQLLAYVKKKFAFLAPNSLQNIKDIGDFQLVAPYKSNIISWYIHWKVE